MEYRNMDQLVQQLKMDGIAKGLCRQWQIKLNHALGYKELAQLYIKGIKFCISKNYPTLDFIREHFKGKCEAYGVFIDDDDVVSKNLPDVVLNGKCIATLEYDGYNFSMIYARDDTIATVNVSDNAIVTIDAYDRAHLKVMSAGGNARVLVNIHGAARVETSGERIKVRYYEQRKLIDCYEY